MMKFHHELKKLDSYWMIKFAELKKLEFETDDYVLGFCIILFGMMTYIMHFFCFEYDIIPERYKGVALFIPMYVMLIGMWIRDRSKVPLSHQTGGLIFLISFNVLIVIMIILKIENVFIFDFISYTSSSSIFLKKKIC